MSKPWETYRSGGTVKLRRRPVRYQHTTSSKNPPPSTEAAEVTIATAVGEADTEDYATWLKADLVSLADERGLDSTGTKADLIARLEDA